MDVALAPSDRNASSTSPLSCRTSSI